MRYRAFFISIFFIAILTVLISGCGGLLESDRYVESRHYIAPYNKTEDTEERIEVSGYDELMDAVLNLIMGHEGSGKYIIYNYEGEDLQEDIERVESEILNYNPIGAYAVSGIDGVIRRVASYTELDVSIEYKKTKEQVDSIVNVSTLRYLRTELLSAMSEYRDEVVFHTALDITEDFVREYIRETYYQNPRNIIMLPGVAIETILMGSAGRIVELRFGYIEQTSILRDYSVSLNLYIRRNAEFAAGGNDGEILISLIENIIASARFDVAAARAISEHGTQNFAATAFGALVRQGAVGEGFAMAFKALCDELGFDCRIVLGNLNGMIHAWNIVLLSGDYYHIDVAMSAFDGIESFFLKTDEDFADMLYIWDFENTVRCSGLLTYEDFVFIEEPDDPDEIDDPDANGENEEPDDPDNPVDSEGAGEPGDSEDNV